MGLNRQGCTALRNFCRELECPGLCLARWRDDFHQSSCLAPGRILGIARCEQRKGLGVAELTGEFKGNVHGIDPDPGLGHGDFDGFVSDHQVAGEHEIHAFANTVPMDCSNDRFGGDHVIVADQGAVTLKGAGLHVCSDRLDVGTRRKCAVSRCLQNTDVCSTVVTEKLQRVVNAIIHVPIKCVQYCRAIQGDHGHVASVFVQNTFLRTHWSASSTRRVFPVAPFNSSNSPSSIKLNVARNRS